MGTPKPIPPQPPALNPAGSSFIITTTAWVDSSVPCLWQLLADVRGWPRWWTAVASADPPPLQGRPTARPRRPGARVPRWWRQALGWPLQLVVSIRASQAPEWLTLQLQGDLRGQATFMLQAAAGPAHGVDLTCRCELEDPRRSVLGPLGFRPWSPGFESQVVRWLQTLVDDLGQALNCRTQRVGHWQGSVWHR